MKRELAIGDEVVVTGRGKNTGRHVTNVPAVIKDRPTQHERREFFVTIGEGKSSEFWEWFSEEELEPI